MKKVYAKEEVCIGCRLCEVYCITAHSQSKNIIKAYKMEEKPVARLIVEEDKPVSFSLQCRHCSDALCTKACITGAMRKDPVTGVVTLDKDKCVGCWSCIMICPFGAVKRDENNEIAAKCDLCAQEGIPACGEHCPNEALVYEDRG